MTAYTRRALLIALVVKSLGYLKSSLARSEEHTSELQSPDHLVCRLLLEKKKQNHLLSGGHLPSLAAPVQCCCRCSRSLLYLPPRRINPYIHISLLIGAALLS